uniref:Uncharacterized protein n=1 Tax=Anopheles atroparvus TaxID=41427 RepID=A0AAG5D3S6_ANOAO
MLRNSGSVVIRLEMANESNRFPPNAKLCRDGNVDNAPISRLVRLLFEMSRCVRAVCWRIPSDFISRRLQSDTFSSRSACNCVEISPASSSVKSLKEASRKFRALNFTKLSNLVNRLRAAESCVRMLKESSDWSTSMDDSLLSSTDKPSRVGEIFSDVRPLLSSPKTSTVFWKPVAVRSNETNLLCERSSPSICRMLLNSSGCNELNSLWPSKIFFSPETPSKTPGANCTIPFLSNRSVTSEYSLRKIPVGSADR